MQWREQHRIARINEQSQVGLHVEVSKAIRERDEWRDRFKQQEDISRRLQKKVDAMQEEYREHVAKLKERCSFDPNEPKRVQLCVASLQKTLEGRTHEFDEIQSRLRETLAANSTLIHTNVELEEQRATLLATIARQNAHRMRSILIMRAREYLYSAWKAWTVRTVYDNERQKREESFQRMAFLVKQSKKSLLKHQAIRFYFQRSKSILARIVRAWAAYTQTLQIAHRTATARAKDIIRRTNMAIFQAWRLQVVHLVAQRTNLDHLYRRIRLKQLRLSWGRWMQSTSHSAIVTIVSLQRRAETERDEYLKKLRTAQEELTNSTNIKESMEDIIREMEIAQAMAKTELSKQNNLWTSRLAHEHSERRRICIQGKIFSWWKRGTTLTNRLKHFQRHWRSKNLQRTIKRWRAYRRVDPLYVLMQSHVQERYNLRLQRHIFSPWAKWIKDFIVLRRKMARRQERLDHTRTKVHWKKWREWILFRREQNGPKMAALFETISQHLVRKAWHRWQRVVIYLAMRDSRLKSVTETAFKRGQAQRLYLTWVRWKKYISASRRRREWIDRKRFERENRMVRWTHSVWRTWFIQCLIQIRQKQSLELLLVRLRGRKLRRSLWQWATTTRCLALQDVHNLTVTMMNSTVASLHEEKKRKEQEHLEVMREMEFAMQESSASMEVTLKSRELQWTDQLSELEKSLADQGASADAWQIRALLGQSRLRSLEIALLTWEEFHQRIKWSIDQERDRWGMQQEDHRGMSLVLSSKLQEISTTVAALTEEHDKKVQEMENTADQLMVKMGAKALECLLQRTTVYCFNRWKAYVENVHTVRSKTRKVVELLQANKVALVFRRWQQFHHQIQAQLEIKKKWERLHGVTLVTTTFQAWSSLVADQRKLKSMLSLMGLASARRTTASVWRQWRNMASTQRAQRKSWTRTFELLARQMYFVSFSQWSTVAKAIAEEYKAAFKLEARGKATNTIQRTWNSIVIRHIFLNWRDNVRVCQHQAWLLRRCAARFQHIATGKTFEVWRENAWRQRRDRIASNQVRSWLLNHILRNAWGTWRQHRLDVTQAERQRLRTEAEETATALATARAMINELTAHVESSKEKSRHLADSTLQLKRQLCASKCLSFIQTTLRTAFLLKLFKSFGGCKDGLSVDSGVTGSCLSSSKEENALTLRKLLLFIILGHAGECAVSGMSGHKINVTFETNVDVLLRLLQQRRQEICGNGGANFSIIRGTQVK
ncbi:hypothetical protein LEN26_015373 [Aphanomyces euteiches]|nr:hypothetical protein LEN26_015373 [Aphanomyces euteiches]KAH9115762.1 hypothetical protein AeMF1_010207 [Aphanomyces euteiches]